MGKLKADVVLNWEHLEKRLTKPLVVPPVELWLVRHGETTTNANGLITGISDAPLTAKGRQQAHEAGLLLAGRAFEIAWSSTLRRSKETLDEILRANTVAAASVQEDERIDERSLGELELAPTRPIEEFARGDLSYAPLGGESYESVAQRCLSFLLDIADLSLEAGHSLKLLVCSHVGPMRIVAGILDKIADPVEVLKLHFDNSVPKSFEFSQLEFPVFVRQAWKQKEQAAA